MSRLMDGPGRPSAEMTVNYLTWRQRHRTCSAELQKDRPPLASALSRLGGPARAVHLHIASPFCSSMGMRENILIEDLMITQESALAGSAPPPSVAANYASLSGRPLLLFTGPAESAEETDGNRQQCQPVSSITRWCKPDWTGQKRSAAHQVLIRRPAIPR